MADDESFDGTQDSDDDEEGESSPPRPLPPVWGPFNHRCASSLVIYMLRLDLVAPLEEASRNRILRAIYTAVPALEWHYDYWLTNDTQSPPLAFHQFYQQLIRLFTLCAMVPKDWLRYLPDEEPELPTFSQGFAVPEAVAPPLIIPTKCTKLFQLEFTEFPEAEESPPPAKKPRVTKSEPTDQADPPLTPKTPGSKPNVSFADTPTTSASSFVASGSFSSGGRALRSNDATPKSAGKRKAEELTPSFTALAETDDDDDDEIGEAFNAGVMVDVKRHPRPGSGAPPSLQRIDKVNPKETAQSLPDVIKHRFKDKIKQESYQVNIDLGPTHPLLYCFKKDGKMPLRDVWSHIIPESLSRDTAKKTYKEQFGDIPLIDTTKIHRVKLDGSILPLRACAACVFFCVHKKVRCEDRMTLLERIKFYQEITDNHGIASDVTPALYQEFIDSYRRLQEITTVYQSASLDFGTRFGKFLRHVNVCVDDMGADNFLRRFSKVNNDEPDVIVVLNHLLEQAKIIGDNDKAMEKKSAMDTSA
ncbi:hypothetical protein FB451DRAFT_1397889 [Mycena latifolia]|nr:hypothetical protein FB451DRAFT_1397889 [Mycena latifolia]